MKNNFLIWYCIVVLVILFAVFNYRCSKGLAEVEKVETDILVEPKVVVNEVKPEPEIEPVISPKANKGTFRVTAYCACEKCCGKWAVTNGGGITASGTKVKEGRTIAVCRQQIPFNTEVYIEGMGTYIAEDTGSAIKENCIDIYFDSHEEARQFGVKYLEVEW